jgi:membrane protein implicated in regulation of membrane protease activity
MRPSRLIIALILALVGIVWIGQGTGLIGGSAMTGSAFWAVAGVILIALSVVIIVLERRLTTRG